MLKPSHFLLGLNTKSKDYGVLQDEAQQQLSSLQHQCSCPSGHLVGHTSDGAAVGVADTEEEADRCSLYQS